MVKASAGSEYREASFTLLLVKDDIVIDQVGMIGTGFTANNTTTFSGSFADNGFEYSTLAYRFKAR